MSGRRTERVRDGQTLEVREGVGYRDASHMKMLFSSFDFCNFPVKISPSKVLPKELNLVSSSGFISRIIIFPGVMIANIHS